MLVVTDVKLVRVDRHYLEIISYDPPSVMARTVDEGPMEKDCVIEKELIQGEMFVTGTGERITIGLSKDVRKALGIPLEEVEYLRKRNEGLSSDLRKEHHKVNELVEQLAEYRNQINVYKSLSIWGGLKFLFTGRIKNVISKTMS